MRYVFILLIFLPSLVFAQTAFSSRQYAEINKDGVIMYTRGVITTIDSENYRIERTDNAHGLSVEKVEYPDGPAYELTFTQALNIFSVETEIWEKVKKDLVKLDPKKYRVRFIGSGFGNHTRECNFTIMTEIKR